MKHEYEHIANQHVLKLFMAKSVTFFTLLASSYHIWKKLEPRINKFFVNFSKKFSRLSKFLQYGTYFIASNIVIMGSYYASLSLFQKTLGRYFERCADNFTHDNPSELHKLLIGLTDSLSEMREQKGYEQYESSWTNYLFGPHDPIGQRISTIQKRINAIETKYPELKTII